MLPNEMSSIHQAYLSIGPAACLRHAEQSARHESVTTGQSPTDHLQLSDYVTSCCSFVNLMFAELRPCASSVQQDPSKLKFKWKDPLSEVFKAIKHDR